MPEAQWRAENESLVGAFNTTVFDIHSVDSMGYVAKETGPMDNGFIIRIRPNPVSLWPHASPVYGRSNHPYWMHYFQVYGDRYPSFRVDVIYGGRTDKKILEAIFGVIDKRFGTRSRF